jgi:trigger factor
VQVTTERQENCIVKLTIAVDERKSREYLQRAARTLSRRYRLPGFRPGKAPYSVVVRNLGIETVQSQVLEQFGDEVFEAGLAESELNPADQANLDDVTWDPSFTLHLSVPIMPEVDLGAYRDIRIPREVAEVSDAEVQEALLRLQKEQGEHEPKEGAAELGDQVVLDITGTVDGETVLENVAREMVLDSEARYPIPGFADAVVGMQADETRTFTLAYPEDHYNADVAGKEAEFKVHLDEIRGEVLPELDDEFAIMVGDYEDLEDLKAKLRQNLEEQAESAADEAFDEAMWDALLATASVAYPAVSVTQEIDEYQRQFEMQLRQQGMDLDSFFQLTGTTPEAWREQVRPQAVERLKRRTILTEIIRAEQIEVEDNEVDAAIERVIEPMGDRADDMRKMLNSEQGKLSIKQDLLVDKAQELLRTLLVADAGGASADEASADEASADEASDDTASGDAEETPEEEPEAEEAETPTEEAVAEEAAEPVEKQNLTRIEGIGPKTEVLLNNAGILNYAQLASAEIGQLAEILAAAGSHYRSMKPDTWPQQASLAAESKWDELKALQGRISGGVLVDAD